VFLWAVFVLDSVVVLGSAIVTTFGWSFGLGYFKSKNELRHLELWAWMFFIELSFELVFKCHYGHFQTFGQFVHKTW
jgi:hypothetical protein